MTIRRAFHSCLGHWFVVRRLDHSFASCVKLFARIVIRSSPATRVTGSASDHPAARPSVPETAFLSPGPPFIMPTICVIVPGGASREPLTSSIVALTASDPPTASPIVR